MSVRLPNYFAKVKGVIRPSLYRLNVEDVDGQQWLNILKLDMLVVYDSERDIIADAMYSDLNLKLSLTGCTFILQYPVVAFRSTAKDILVLDMKN